MLTVPLLPMSMTLQIKKQIQKMMMMSSEEGIEVRGFDILKPESRCSRKIRERQMVERRDEVGRKEDARKREEDARKLEEEIWRK